MGAPRKSFCSSFYNTITSLRPESRYKRFKNSTYVPGNPLLGHALNLMSRDGKAVGKFVENLEQHAVKSTTGRSYAYINARNIGMVVSRKEDIELIFTQFGDQLQRYDATGSFKLPFGDDSIFAAEDEKKHDELRKPYSIWFNEQRVRNQIARMQEVADKSNRKVDEHKELKLGEFCSLSTMSQISDQLALVDVKEENQKKAAKLAHNIMTEVASGKHQILGGLFPKTIVKAAFPYTTMGHELKKGAHLLRSTFLKDNKRTIENTRNFLNPQGKSTTVDLSTDDAIDKIKEVFVAGHDTAKVALRACLSLLADSNHKLILKTVQKELDSRKDPSSPLTDEEIEHFPYLKAVVLETLRLYPPVPDMVFPVKKEIELSDGTMYPDDVFVISPRILQRNPDIWGADADKFNPERFLGKKEEDFPWEFFPFGFDMKNHKKKCPGRHFAKREIELIVAMLLSKHDIEFVDSNKHHPFPFHQVFTMRFDDEEISVRFPLRKPKPVNVSTEEVTSIRGFKQLGTL